MDLDFNLMTSLYFINTDITKAAQKDIESHGINGTEFLILNHLLIRKDVRTQSIVDVTKLCNGSITYEIQKMIKNGTIERRNSEVDKRVYLHNITTKGKNIIEKVNEKHTKFLNSVFSNLTDHEKFMYEKIFKEFKGKLNVK